MPTFKISVLKHQLRRDGKLPVSIRVTHNRESAYLKTDFYVLPKQVSPDYKSIRDANVVRQIDRDIIEYENLLLREFGSNLSRFTAKELVTFIERHTATSGGANIDFIAFSRNYITHLKAEGRNGYAIGFDAVIRALVDYFSREKVFIKEINTKNLKGFADYMLTQRKMTRINQFGKEYTITRPPVKTQTVASYLGVIHTLFNAACEEYNSENDETALITHNPFRKQLIKVTDTPEKRNLSVEDLIKIIKYKNGTSRQGLARDLFLLSFYFVGMNTADIFAVNATALSDGRLTYKRQKTTTRRKDEALISIKVEPEVKDLLKKYSDPNKKKVFSFYTMYANYRTFNSNLNIGCKQLASELKLPSNLSTYFARHTWSTIASVDCGIPDNDIGIALNHVGDSDDRDKSKSLKVTRGYIGRTWEKIDKIHRQVLDFVNAALERA